MLNTGRQGSRRGGRIVVIALCLGALALSLFGVLGVVALTAIAVSSDAGPSVSASTVAPSATPSTSPTSAAASAPTPAPARPRAAAAVLVPVVGVTDGDTIRVRIDGTTERVRLIGIDTPELTGGECWAQKAASRMQSLVQSRSVQLVLDPSQGDRDRFGRLLRHVVTQDGTLVGTALIEGGFGREYTYAKPYLHRDAHLAAQQRARAAGLGVWSAACAAPAAAP
ncbi:thermonuclease family protein, partial [Knoellia aerolata]